MWAQGTTAARGDKSAMRLFAKLLRILVYNASAVRVDLIKPVSNVRPYVRPSTKRFFDFNEIWYVSRGRRVMYDGK